MIDELAGEPDWTPLVAGEVIGTSVSFLSGDPDNLRLRLRYFQRGSDQALVARVWFGPGAQGPPGHAHGGSMAAVLDETMGMAAWVAGHSVVAAGLNIEFRRMLPLGTVATVETRIAAVEGRKIRVEGRILDREGNSYAEAAGLFIVISLDRFGGVRPGGFG